MPRAMSDARSTGTRAKRSATVPPTSVKSATGRKVTMSTEPITTADPVSWSTHHASTTS